MRLLADENVSSGAIATLRNAGHDVMSVKESMPGQSDKTILTKGVEQDRVVLTHDKGFAELAFRQGLRADCGVVLFRFSGASPEQIRNRISSVMESSLEWRGKFVVVTDDRIRVRPLPSHSD